MKNSIILFFIFFSFLNSIELYSQKNIELEYLLRNITHSIENIKNEKNKLINEKENKLFHKDFLPNVSLSFSLPSYNRSISNILQPDGTYAFRESNNANSRVSLSVSQKIPFTGGTLSISNSFSRLDLFGDNQKSTSYSASWFGINLSQPLNFFNGMKWDKKIQQAKVSLDEINYKKNRIKVKGKVFDLYYDLIKIKNREIILNREVSIAYRYKGVIHQLVKAGKKNDLDSIDIELKILEKNKSLNLIKKKNYIKTQSINNFFNSKIVTENSKLEFPKIIFDLKPLSFYINKYTKLFLILEENRLLNLEKEINQLKKNRFYNAKLTLGVGFNNSTEELGNIFHTPNQSQNISLSLNVPLLDFGKKRIELEMAETQHELEILNLKQEKTSTIDNITYLYEEIIDLLSSLKIEDARMNLLEKKIDRMEALLFSQKVLLKDYTDIEDQLYNSTNEKINLLHKMHKKIIELEEITLFEIILPNGY